LSKSSEDINQGRVYYKKEEMEVWFKYESFVQFIRYKKIETAKAAILMWFRERGMRQSVTKDKQRKSIRHVAIKIDSYEKEEIEAKIKEQEEVL
jgi:tRNA(Phe) wybutosine-synthesizing methylase Tyw3